MSLRPSKHLVPLVLTGVLLLGCVHTPPGTNVNIALAKRAELVRPPATPVPAHSNVAHAAPAPVKSELVADAYSRGEFCAKAGKDDEAIAAFKEAVRIDPTFVDAWTYLAAIYEKKGNEKEALNAFKHAKLATTKGAG